MGYRTIKAPSMRGSVTVADVEEVAQTIGHLTIQTVSAKGYGGGFAYKRKFKFSVKKRSTARRKR